ncbi:MAG: aspartate--tRNA ligase, partial [Acidimicrobiia bacterium]
MDPEPFRSAHAGDLRRQDAGSAVRLAGWVNARRDHGGVVFVDLRDASGLVQVVLNPGDEPATPEVLHGLRNEYCLAVSGVVRERMEGTANPDLDTGEVEVVAHSLDVLSPALTLPFQIDDREDVDEARRLQYRYLDLRRPRLAANLRARSDAIKAMRRVLDRGGFLEIETPTLVASTPEGARDLLVPSRLRPGQFYALPQSPQLFKQLLMIGGVERYYQVARCYRDEDFRSDRQIEFTQLDLEGAFWGQDDVLAVLEEVASEVVRDLRDVELPRPFLRMTYAEAIARYGTDKPDLRFGMEIEDLSALFAATEFRAFRGVLDGGNVIRGFNAGGLGLSRAGLDGVVSKAQDLGAKGLVWMVVEDDGSLRSPVSKFLSEEETSGVVSALGGAPGDVLLLVADDAATTAHVLGQIRLELGRPEGHDDLAFVFIVDFPMFDRVQDGSLTPAHHPFTAPADVTDMRERPATSLSRSYDL